MAAQFGIPPYETQTLNREKADSARSAFMNLKPEAPAYAVSVFLLLDISKSMPAKAVSYMLGAGVNAIVDTLKQASRTNGYRYNLAVGAFSTQTELLLPPTYVDTIGKPLALVPSIPREWTCIESALGVAFGEIDGLKRKLDDARISREGAMAIIVTDGEPTDAGGCITALSPALVEEVKDRNSSRRTTTIAFGLGRVKETTLAQLGPGFDLRLDNGEVLVNPHAFKIEGESYEDAGIWEKLVHVMALASSSSDSGIVDAETGSYYGNEPVFVCQGEPVPDDVEAAFIEMPSGFNPVTCS